MVLASSTDWEREYLEARAFIAALIDHAGGSVTFKASDLAGKLDRFEHGALYRTEDFKYDTVTFEVKA